MQKDDEFNPIGSFARLTRQAQGRTLLDVAEEIGVTFAYLSLIERGGRTPSMETLQALTEALHFSVTIRGNVIECE